MKMIAPVIHKCVTCGRTYSNEEVFVNSMPIMQNGVITHSIEIDVSDDLLAYKQGICNDCLTALGESSNIIIIGINPVFDEPFKHTTIESANMTEHALKMPLAIAKKHLHLKGTPRYAFVPAKTIKVLELLMSLKKSV